MTEIDDYYQKLVQGLKADQKFLISAKMLDSVTDMVAHQIRLSDPNISERKLRFLVIKKLYMADEKVKELIDIMENDFD